MDENEDRDRRPSIPTANVFSRSTPWRSSSSQTRSLAQADKNSEGALIAPPMSPLTPDREHAPPAEPRFALDHTSPGSDASQSSSKSVYHLARTSRTPSVESAHQPAEKEMDRGDTHINALSANGALLRSPFGDRRPDQGTQDRFVDAEEFLEGNESGASNFAGEPAMPRALEVRAEGEFPMT